MPRRDRATARASPPMPRRRPGRASRSTRSASRKPAGGGVLHLGGSLPAVSIPPARDGLVRRVEHVPVSSSCLRGGRWRMACRPPSAIGWTHSAEVARGPPRRERVGRERAAGPGGRARRRSSPGGRPRRRPWRRRAGRRPARAGGRGRRATVPLAEHLAQPVGLAQPGGGTEDVADRDRAAEHGGGVLAHRVVGEGDEVVVPGEDLRPVGLLGARRVVVQGGDGGLDLVAAGALRTASADCRTRTPSAISRVSHRPRSCRSSVTIRPSESSRAGRRAWLRSISASSPRASGSSVARVSWRASRIASPARSTRPAWPAV